MASKVNIDRSKLHPWLDYKLTKLIEKLDKKKMGIIVTCGYRSSAEQDELYAQGRTKKGNIITNAKGGQSQHNVGVAIDIAMNYDVDKDKKIADDTWNSVGFKKVAKIAKKLGFGWGGDWVSIKDMPHFYLPKWGSTPTKIYSKYGTFAKFKKTWRGKTTKKLNLYKKQVLLGKILTAPKGAEVDVLWRKLGVAKVKCKGKYGYMKSKYVK